MPRVNSAWLVVSLPCMRSEMARSAKATGPSTPSERNPKIVSRYFSR